MTRLISFFFLEQLEQLNIFMSSAVLERALHVISSATELSVARITSALRDVIKDRAIPVPSMSKSPAPAGKHF